MALRMTDQTGPPRRSANRSRDREPVDPPIARRPPDAMAADGELVSNTEIEAAAEFSRALGRIGVTRGPVDGFTLFRAYRWIAGRRIAARRFRA